MNEPRPVSPPSGVIRPQGPRLILANAHLLTEEGMALINGGAGNITIDLAEIEFVDSSGIGALIGLRKRIPRGEVTLENVGNFLYVVLKKTKTASLFKFGKN